MVTEDCQEVLARRGAATPLTWDLVENAQQSFRRAVCILCFQLPFPLHVTEGMFALPSANKRTLIHLVFHKLVAVVDQFGVLHVYDNEGWNGANLPDHYRRFECTQCIAIVPLWGTREQYYSRYLDCVRRGRMNEVILPMELNPYQERMPGSVTAIMFEDDMASRALSLVYQAVCEFLKQYIIMSLDEVPLPDRLLSLFAVTAPDRAFLRGKPCSLIFGLLREKQSSSIRQVAPADIQAALAWPARDFTSFELQVLALKRLADEGEPGVALIGLLALVEWFLKGGPSKKSLNKLLNEDYRPVMPVHIREKLNRARCFRNEIVHEAPPTKIATYNPNAYSGRRGVIDKDTQRTMEAFKEAASASFGLYRWMNMTKRPPERTRV